MMISSTLVQRGGVASRSRRDLADPWEGCELRCCRHFRGLLGGPAEWSWEQIPPRHRGSLGAAICAAVATFVGSWEVQRSGVVDRSRRDLADPWGVANCAIVARTYVRAYVHE